MRAPGSDPLDSPPVPTAAPSRLWLLLLLVALTELLALPVRVSRVASPADFTDVATFVRDQWQQGDAVEIAPAWADPWLRWALGDHISLADAGRSDRARYGRLWTLSLHGLDVDDPPKATPDVDQLFGRVRLRRQRLPPSSVLYDFVDSVRDAVVVRVMRGMGQPCAWTTMPPARGGGLGVGVLHPTERFSCDTRRPWLYVAPVVMEDLDLKPRYCLWHHPQGPEPITARFDRVPVGDELVFEGGLYYEHERDRKRGPVHVNITLNGVSAARMVHSDGDGFKRIVIDTRAAAGTTGSVGVEVTADEPHFRTFCWSGSTRRSATRDATSDATEGVAR